MKRTDDSLYHDVSRIYETHKVIVLNTGWSKSLLYTWRLYCNHQVHRDFLITLYINQEMHYLKSDKIRLKIQYMISINSYIFRHQTAIFRESTKTKEHESKTPIVCFSWLPEDEQSGAETCRSWYCHELYFMICILLCSGVRLLAIILNIGKCTVYHKIRIK